MSFAVLDVPLFIRWWIRSGSRPRDNLVGGTLTTILAAVDDRLAAAVVSSGNTENVACADFHPPGSVDDAEQNFIGAGPAGFDRWDLLWPFAPRPLLILTSAKDFFGVYSPDYVENGLEEYGHLSEAYRVLGKQERLNRASTPLPHGFSYALRLETYRWLSRWLKDEERTIDAERTGIAGIRSRSVGRAYRQRRS